VILQGLGTKWIHLPARFVSDVVNQRLSKAELSFLRSGLMGSLRDFYVTKRHEKTFVDRHGRTVVFKNDPERGFTIEVHGGDPPIDLTGADEFELELVVAEPEPLDVSRTLPKMAYLALCVAMPSLALSPTLNEARRFIHDGNRNDFRPYAERFVSGAWPGFDVCF